MSIKRILSALSLIGLGCIFLAINFGILKWSFFLIFIRLWPLYLISAGLGIIFAKTSLNFIGSLVNFVVFGSITILAIVSATSAGEGKEWKVGPLTFREGTVQVQRWFRWGEQELITTDYEESLRRNTTSAQLDIKLGAANLTLGATDTALIQGQAQTSAKRTPDYSYSSGDTALVSFKDQAGAWLDWLWWDQTENYDLKLNSAIPWDITIDSGASTSKLDLREIDVQTLDIDTGATTTEIILGDRSRHTAISIDMGAATLILRLPEDAGIYLKANHGLSSMDLPDALIKYKDNQYQTDNYATAQHKVDLELSSGAADITIVLYNPDEGPPQIDNPDDGQETMVEFSEIMRGTNNPYEDISDRAGLVIFNDLEEHPFNIGNFAELIQDHLILGVFQGQQTTGGYAIEIKEIKKQNNELSLIAQITEPGLHDIVIQSLTSPYQIIMIDQADLPADSVITLILKDAASNEIIDQVEWRR
jgi:hypothetical protein